MWIEKLSKSSFEDCKANSTETRLSTLTILGAIIPGVPDELNIDLEKVQDAAILENDFLLKSLRGSRRQKKKETAMDPYHKKGKKVSTVSYCCC